MNAPLRQILIDPEQYRIAKMQQLQTKVSPLMTTLLQQLFTAWQCDPEAYVQHQQIIARLWGRDPNGGPTCTSQSIASLINYNAKTLAQSGWKITGRRGRKGGIRLELIQKGRAV